MLTWMAGCSADCGVPLGESTSARPPLDEFSSVRTAAPREGIRIASAIEELVLIWSATEIDEWTNRIVWIPL